MSWKRTAYRYAIKHKSRIRSILTNISVGHDSRCLDLGCGNGVFSAVLQRIGANVYGIDISISNLRLAAEDTPVIQTDAVELPFKSETFDYVFVLELIYYIDERTSSKEISRVLKPGGVLVITVPYKYPTFDTWNLRNLLGSKYIEGHTAKYDDNLICERFPEFRIVHTDSFSIFFTEILQTLLYRIRQGWKVRPESIITHNPNSYFGASFYRMVYLLFSPLFLFDRFLKKLGAIGHNRVYIMEVLK